MYYIQCGTSMKTGNETMMHERDEAYRKLFKQQRQKPDIDPLDDVSIYKFAGIVQVCLRIFGYISLLYDIQLAFVMLVGSELFEIVKLGENK